MEHIDSLHLLARTHKLDRFGDNSTNRQCSTTTSVTIELSEHDSVEIQSVVKFLGSIHSILTRHWVHHEECLVWIECILESSNLVHHLLVNSQTSGSIHDYDIIALGLSLLDGIICNLNYILVVGFGINRHTNGLTHDLQLLDSSRTIHVASHQQGFLVVLVFQQVGKFTAECCFTRTLQSRHEDYCRTAFQFEFGSLSTHQFCQFVVNDLHHQLPWLDCSKHVHT